MTYPSIDTMTPITEAHLLLNFDEIILAAEHGEYFLITCTEGAQLVLMPYSEFQQTLDQATPPG